MLRRGICDFVVKYDPSKDSQKDLTRRVLQSLIIGRIKYHKPVYWFIGGDSGEGKSLSTLSILLLLYEAQGITYEEFREHMDAFNILTPLQYAEKLDKILFDKSLKKYNFLVIHEAREVVKAKMWYSFLNQSVADINAMSRSVKRLGIIIISQFIRDISSDIRYTLNFYSTVKRPRNGKAKVYMSVLWKDDRDLEKPKLRRRRLAGYVVYPNGRYKRWKPSYIEVSLPPKEIVDHFEKLDFEAKAGIIRKKLDKLMSEMRAEVGETNNKVNVMVDWYITHLESLSMIGKRYRGKWKLKPEVSVMHDLNKMETDKFEKMLNERLNKLGLMGDAPGGGESGGE